MQGFALRTIWLDDPDGITNYFAQVGVKETNNQFNLETDGGLNDEGS